MRTLLCLIVLGLAACDGSTCAPEELVGCPTCGPGQLRRALAVDPHTVLADRGSAGAICAACTEIWSLDANTVAATLALGDGAQILSAAGTPDGSLYVIAEGPTPDPASGTLSALDADNAVRWTMPVATPYATDPRHIPLTEVVAGPAGPFVLTGENDVYASATAFSLDGAQRWTMPVAGELVIADGAGGLYTALGDRETSQAIVQIAQLDANGVQVAMHAIRATPDVDTQVMQVGVSAIALGVDGGLVVAGVTTGAGLDFGDLQVATGSDGEGFVAVFAPSGATTWAHAIAIESWFDAVAATADGVVAVTHDRGDELGLPPASGNAFDLAVVTFAASGMRAAFQIGGAGSQGMKRGPLVVSGDAVWLSIFSAANDAGSTEVVVGGETLDTGGDYLVEVGL